MYEILHYTISMTRANPKLRNFKEDSSADLYGQEKAVGTFLMSQKFEKSTHDAFFIRQKVNY